MNATVVYDIQLALSDMEEGRSEIKEKNPTDLRKVRTDDVERIWEIRNHPDNRGYFLDSKEIPLDKHRTWFSEKYFTNKNNRCYVLEYVGGDVVAYCRFDADNEHNSYRTSIAVDPEHKQQGLGHQLLNKALEKFPRDTSLFAQVKKGNEASVRLFEKNEFIKIGEDAQVYYYQYKKT